MSSSFVDASQARLLKFRSLEGQLPESGSNDAASAAGLPERSQSLDPGHDKSPSERALNEIEREAFQKGYEAGERSGMEMADQKIELILGRFAKSIQELSHLKKKILTQCERDLVALSIDIARKLVQREIRLDPEIIISLVRVAMSKLNEKSKVKIRLSPSDYAVLEGRIQELQSPDAECEVILKASEGLDRGDCLIESEFGTVDARISEQFAEIENGLLGEF